jgi:hypothetical protein
VDCKLWNFGVKIEKPLKLHGFKVNFPQNIIMEGDALEIVHALQKEGCYWTYRQLVEDANLLERISGHGWWGT